MTELIGNNDERNRIQDHRIYSEAFLSKVSQCIQIANTIRTDYGIDILETNGSFELTDEVIHRLDALSSRYFPTNNQNSNSIDAIPNPSSQHDKLHKAMSFYDHFDPTTLSNNHDNLNREEQFPVNIHCISIQLPPMIEMQLKNNRLLREAVNNYRHHERYANSGKNTKLSSIKPTVNEEEEDMLLIQVEPLCPTESNSSHNSSSSVLSANSKASFTKTMKQIRHHCQYKSNDKNYKLITDIKAILNHIINEEIIYEYSQTEVKMSNRSKQPRKSKKHITQILQILLYENTYGHFYYPDQSSLIDQTMMEKIINGVQAMVASLTNTKDAEDILNGIVMLTDQSSTPLTVETTNTVADELMKTIQKRFTTRKQDDPTHRERIRVRMALDLVLADNRLNGLPTLCRSESLVLSCMLRKILLCTQTRMLCSYADVLTTINESDSHQIHLRTCERMSLSSDEFIEIIGEMYHQCYETIETMKYYLEAKDILDIDTHLIHSSILKSKQIDEMMKYILREDAIRLLMKLIFDRKRDNDFNDEYRQFKLVLPTKLNELYQPIKKLNAFMSISQVMTAIRRPYLSQLTQRSKTKAITVNDLRAITSQIWFLPENYDTLIAENTITSDILCQFYTDFHEKDDIDERLNKITKKIQDHSNLHSCITRVVLKMVAEHSNGTSLTPFLDEFTKTPRCISIIDLFDDLLTSGLISTSELIVFSKQEIIIKKSSLLKHFQHVSFIRKHDADRLAEITLVMREDILLDYLTQRAMTMKQAYIHCILNNHERREFITKHIIESTKRLSALSIHEFIRYFNLDPHCGKIFYWMDLTDESIVKTLIETKTFVNEYTLDGIYNNFLTRLHDTLESGIYYISVENFINADRQKDFLTTKHLKDNQMVYKIDHNKLCKLGCFLTYEQASILVDYADPQYGQELSSLITIHDIISQERFKTLLKSNDYEINFEDISPLILPKQQVIECQILRQSFHQRIIYRQKRFERVHNLQKLLLSSVLFDRFIEIIPDLGEEYFMRTELDHLEETKLIDIGVLALLLTLSAYNPLVHQHKYEWFRDKDNRFIHDQQSSSSINYLHILDPVIEKYSIFLTTILMRILSKRERFASVNELLLSNPDDYLSTDEVLKICAYEQILSHDDISRICREVFPTMSTLDAKDQSQQGKQISSMNSSLGNRQDRRSRKTVTINVTLHNNNHASEQINTDRVSRSESRETDITPWSMPDCYTQNMATYSHDPILQHRIEQTMILTIFDYILHFNHRTIINGHFRQLLGAFKPLSIYKAQLLIEKEMTTVKLLFKTRKQQAELGMDDLNRYLESYSIPCRLDIVNELRRAKIISQSLANNYTMSQCHELKAATPEVQTVFLFYMMMKLIREDGYIDETSLKTILHHYQTDTNNQKLTRINQQILRHGFLTIEQIIQSAQAFFLQDYLNADIFKNSSDEYKLVIQERILANILRREHLTNSQFELTLSQNIRRCQVMQTNTLGDQLKYAKIAKEKVQRKVDHVLSKVDENAHPSSKMTQMSSRLTSRSLATKHRLSTEYEQQSAATNENRIDVPLPDLRSLRHNYIQARIPRTQLYLLVEQGGWSNDIHLEFKRELDIIDSNNSLDLIRHITKNISLLIKENGSVADAPLMKHYQHHQILFLADFELLLMRYGMVALEDLIDLLVVSRLTKADEIKSFAKRIFCLNVNKFIEISKSHEDVLVKKNHIQNNLEKRLCVTAADLSQLLNHVLKLDRLKRIHDIMPTIKNYMRLHPINTFNTLKALKLEFDFNHYDMKFLRDLKLINDIWYKRYLVSRTSETGPSIPDIIDEEQEDRQEFKFRSSADDEFDLETFNQLIDNKESHSNINEQRKQAYLERMKKRKDQIQSIASMEEDHLPLLLDLDDVQQRKNNKDQLRVIEQFFPDASTLDSQLLVPYLSDDRKRIFMQLDFAQEQNIEDYYKQHSEDDRYHRTDIEQQMKKQYDTIEEEASVRSDSEVEEKMDRIISEGQSSISSDKKSVVEEIEKDRLTEGEKLSSDDQSATAAESKSDARVIQRTEQTIAQPSIGKSLAQISKLLPLSMMKRTEGEQTGADSSMFDDNNRQLTVDEVLDPSSIKRLISKETIQPSTSLTNEKLPSLAENLHSRPTSSVIPNATEDLSNSLTQLFEQMSDAEQASLRDTLKLIRLHVDQWLQTTLQHSEQIYSIENEPHTNQLLPYLHEQLNIFRDNFISRTLTNSLNNPKLIHLFEQRINQIENVLQEMKNHQEIVQQVHRQIIEIDQTINGMEMNSAREKIIEKLNEKFIKYKERFSQTRQQEDFEIQPILVTRLELAIRTLDGDLQFMEQILGGKTLADVTPTTSLIATRIFRQPIQAIESEAYDTMTFIRDHLLTIAMDVKACGAVFDAKRSPHDLLRIDIAERLQAIKQEYSEQKINEENIQQMKMKLDVLVDFDQQHSEFEDKLREIRNQLDLQSRHIQKNLYNIITARDHSDHPSFPSKTILKLLPVNISGISMEQPFCLVDEQNRALSDELHLIRLPIKTDRFHISHDKHQLTIIDKDELPISDPITFKSLSSELIEYQYTDDDQRTVQILSHPPSNKPIMLNVKPAPFDRLPTGEQPTSQELFVVDDNNHLLSKPIHLKDRTNAPSNIAELKLCNFLYDENTHHKVLLTPEQYLIAAQQAEFTTRKFMTYITDKDNQPMSEAIQLSDAKIQMRHAIESTVATKLIVFDRERHELVDRFNSIDNKNAFLNTMLNQYELICAYVQDRLDKLKTEEKIIEQIIPILDERYQNISTDHVEYKREQSNMDHLLTTMKLIIQFDDRLTAVRKAKTREPLEIQRLENHLIDQLTEVSHQLNDQSVTEEIQNLTNHFQNTQLLVELRPVVLSGIKNRAKIIQRKCETLLINMHEKSNQFQQPEQIRFEYIQYLTKRLNEELDQEKNTEHLYNRIERMQYDLHQKIADSSETITLADLDNEIKHKYHINQIPIPAYLKTKNEILVYKFQLILRYLHDELQTIEQYKKDLVNEMERFQIESIDKENSSSQQINFIQNDIKINKQEKLLKYIEKLKVLLNKLETIDDKDDQHDFLLSKLDRLYAILLNDYQIQLPAKTNIESIRATLNHVRKTTKKDMQRLDTTKNELLRSLEVIKKKEELKQRTKMNSITEDSQLSSLNAYIQQSKIEPLSIRHEFYGMKIQQITKDLVSILDTQSPEQRLSITNSLRKIVEHLESCGETLDRLSNDNERSLKYVAEQLSIAREYSMIDSLVRGQVEDLAQQQNQLTRDQQSITKMRTIVNEALDHLRLLIIPNLEREKNQQLFKELTQRAMDTILQSIEYQHLSQRVSPRLLLLHKFTSGQELIPSISSYAVNQFQIGIEAHIHEELPSEIFLLQHQSSATFQKDYIEQFPSLNRTDLKIQILHTEISYLRKQHAEAIAFGDSSQQLAAEQTILIKLQKLHDAQEESKSPKIGRLEPEDYLATIDQQSVEYDPSKTSIIQSTVSDQSLPVNHIDQEIHGLLENHVKLLRNRIKNEESKISGLEPDTDETPKQSATHLGQESLHDQMVHAVDDLRRLNTDLKTFRQENNRRKQIDVQLQILDKIDQFRTETINEETIQHLRQYLQEEREDSAILTTVEQLQHHSSMRVPPILPSVTEEQKSKTMLQQTIIPITSEIIPQTESAERINQSLITSNAKELYQELQKIRYSIELALENTALPSSSIDTSRSLAGPLPVRSGVTIERDEEHVQGENMHRTRIPSQSQLRANSIEEMQSSLLPTNTVPESATIASAKAVDISKSDPKKASSPLVVVGNVKKYSVAQKKANERQIASPTVRSVFQSQREYGDVYVRHKVTGITSPGSHKDEEQNKADQILHSKVQRKLRLVKYEKTRQGNTVIHRQVSLPTNVLMVPQRANYEENLQPAPPLIYVEQATNGTLNQISTRLSKTKLDFEQPNLSHIKVDHRNKQSDVSLPVRSSNILSPIEEEEEEVEMTSGIAFSLSNQDSSTKKSFTNARNKSTEFSMSGNDGKSLEKSSTLQETPSGTSTMSASHNLQSVQGTQQQTIDANNRVPTMSSPSSFIEPPHTSNISEIVDLIKSPESKKLKTKSSKKKHKLTDAEQTEDDHLMAATNDESLSTQVFDIEQELQQPIPIMPESKVVYHRVGGKLKQSKKKKKKKKTKQTNTSGDRTKTKRHKVETISELQPMILVPRKAVPFISATKGKQIDVEEDVPIRSKKKKRTRSSKSNRQLTRSRSSSTNKSSSRRRKRSKNRAKKQLAIEEKTNNVAIESNTMTNKDAIAKHQLNVSRFTGPPISAISYDHTRHKYDNVIEISDDMIEQSRLKLLKPMLKNFELDNNFHRYTKDVHNIDAYDLDKELFDFNNDTRDINQPAMFTEYIPEFFQKQAEEKQIRRISLTAIKTDEHLIKRLAPRISRLYNGWQPSNTPCAHTDEFRPLNKYLMSDISYYFDDDFIDESGLFRNQKNLDKIQPRLKQPTQRFRDDYIVKEFFNCWKDYTTEKARIAELRRKRVTIDFREFWFQDACSDPFYSYFEQPPDYAKKQDNHHQMAYRLHKRLVRTGREQPKETMNGVDRSSFLPLLFNLPKNQLDRQVSLTRRRQFILDANENHSIPLSNLVTHSDELLPLIRERLHRIKAHTNTHGDELAIKQLLIDSSLLKEGTMNDLDQFIVDYYTTLDKQEMKPLSKSSSTVIKLPMLKQSSHRTLTLTK